MSAICKRALSVLLASLLLLFPGCVGKEQSYHYTYLDVFDTVTAVTVVSGSRAEADRLAELIHSELTECHRLFDIYHEYDGLNNLCTVNRLAGSQPVTVDERILDLLELSLKIGEASGWKLNICAGSLFSLWHEARTAAASDEEHALLPEETLLRQAQEHISPDGLLIDRSSATIRFLDPDLKLDVGAVAKGWAVQRACELAKTAGYDDFLISAGGNVCACGRKGDGSRWKVGLEDPNGSGTYLTVLELMDCSAVTSGSYQRYYVVDGERYCHIIDPESGFPGREYEMVTVLCSDSAVADALSTALFLLPQEEGGELADMFGAEALWYADGASVTTAGFPMADS